MINHHMENAGFSAIEETQIKACHNTPIKHFSSNDETLILPGLSLSLPFLQSPGLEQ